MKSWTWNTNQGLFRINLIGSHQIRLLFGETIIGSFPSLEQAAHDCGTARHAPISESFDGESLGVPVLLKDWTVASERPHQFGAVL